MTIFLSDGEGPAGQKAGSLEEVQDRNCGGKEEEHFGEGGWDAIF